MSSFIGREAELSEVGRLIAASRLVTLTGSGGAGKTRLALQLAAGLLDGSGDGVWFVDLAPLQDPELVAVTVANVLGIPVDEGRPAADTLVDAVGRHSLLVLLDNCEHVIDACAKLADALLRSCPNIVLLATSREPLGIAGEYVHRVPSLDTPAEDDTTESIGNSEAVRLFTDRAAQHGVALAWDERTTSVAGRICRLLDGIPLAIELAAARLRVMPVTELDARLDRRFSLLTGGSRAALPRQQTLLAMVDWSWELLNAAERQVLARLSVFAGGFDLAAAEAVTAGGSIHGTRPWRTWEPWSTRTSCSSTTAAPDQPGTGCWKLSGSTQPGSSNARTRGGARRADFPSRPLSGSRAVGGSATHRSRSGRVARPSRSGTGQSAGRDRLWPGSARPRIRPQLVIALRVFWKARGHATEGVDSLRALLAVPAAQGPTLGRARGLATAAYLLDQTGGYAPAEKYCEEALAIAKPAADSYLVADLLSVHAFVLLRRGRQDTALPLIEEGLRLGAG